MEVIPGITGSFSANCAAFSEDPINEGMRNRCRPGMPCTYSRIPGNEGIGLLIEKGNFDPLWPFFSSKEIIAADIKCI